MSADVSESTPLGAATIDVSPSRKVRLSIGLMWTCASTLVVVTLLVGSAVWHADSRADRLEADGRDMKAQIGNMGGEVRAIYEALLQRGMIPPHHLQPANDRAGLSSGPGR